MPQIGATKRVRVDSVSSKSIHVTETDPPRHEHTLPLAGHRYLPTAGIYCIMEYIADTGKRLPGWRIFRRTLAP
jgi:hypothetical protein